MKKFNIKDVLFMTSINRNLLSVIIFLFFFLFGVVATYEYYYPSEFLYIYWVFCSILIFFSLKSGIYKEFEFTKQSAALIFILLIYLASWFLVPQVLRFGAFLFSSFCFLYTGIIFLNSKYRLARIVFILAFIISCFNIIPILIFITQESKITQELISTIFISNVQEAKEYVIANFSILHGLVLFTFFSTVFLLFFFKRQDSSRKINMSLVLLFIISFLTSSLSGPSGALSSEYLSYLYQKKKLEKLVLAREEGLMSINYHIQPDSNQANKVVVIIGESLNRSYMSLYGYERNTTPLLSKMASDTNSNGRLFVFNDVISPDVTTVPSLKKVLTNSTNEQPIPFEKSVGIIDFFKKAGFKSYWISNQAPLGKFSTPISVISSAADSVYFTAFNNESNNGAPQGTFFDGELIKPFGSILSTSKDHEKQIYFIHLMGNHVNYEDRYPKNFNIFKTKEPLSRNLYLNSIIYNDWIVDEIIKIAKENDVDIVCYFSDHGDELGYGHSAGNYKRGMSTVPFMVYLSKKYMSKNPNLVQQLIKNKDTPAMTDNFFNVIQELTGTRSSVFNAKNTFISDDYILLKRRVLDNTILFDK